MTWKDSEVHKKLTDILHEKKKIFPKTEIMYFSVVGKVFVPNIYSYIQNMHAETHICKVIDFIT